MTTTTRAADRGLAGQEQSPSPRTAAHAAAILGVTTRTLYRWANDGVIPRDWWAADLSPYAGLRLPKGRARNPHAVRYTTGRHRFDEVRGRHRNAVDFSASEGGEG